MADGKLIAITGPAASGKSTLTRAVQAEFTRRGELCLILELDVFGRGVPRDWVAFSERRGAQAGRGFSYDRGADGSVALTLGPDGRRVLAAFHRAVAASVRSGMTVVCETIVYDEDDWRDWCEALGGIDACWVRLSAPVAALEAREQADRSRVFQGLARGMSARPSVGRYMIEADTSVEGAEAIAAQIFTTSP